MLTKKRPFAILKMVIKYVKKSSKKERKLGANKMTTMVSYVNAGEFEKAYTEIFASKTGVLESSALDFLYKCTPSAAYDFLMFCFKRNTEKELRFSICEFISYGDIVIEESHNIVYELIISILTEDPDYLPALQFVLYNYCEHPESPFNAEEMVTFAKTMLRSRNDRIATKVLKLYT